MGSNEGALLKPSRVSNSLKTDWQRHVLASRSAAQVLEEIAPEDKNRTEVLGMRVQLYMAAKKWDMAAAVANHLVKVEPENSGWWINLAYATRRCEGVKSAEAILLQARELHHNNAMIEFNLACYSSVMSHKCDCILALLMVGCRPCQHLFGLK
jgi:Flp pilus assembly protein TadD